MSPVAPREAMSVAHAVVMELTTASIVELEQFGAPQKAVSQLLTLLMTDVLSGVRKMLVNWFSARQLLASLLEDRLVIPVWHSLEMYLSSSSRHACRRQHVLRQAIQGERKT